MDTGNRITSVCQYWIQLHFTKVFRYNHWSHQQSQFVGTRNIIALSTEHPYQITPTLHVSASSHNGNLVTFFKVMLLINNHSRVRSILFTFEMKVLVSQETRHCGTQTSTGLFKGQVHGSAHAHLSKCCFSAATCCIVYAGNMIML